MQSNVTVKTPASSRLLVHPDRAREDLGLDADDVSDTALLRLIAGASASVSAFFNQRRDDDGAVTIVRETIVETWRRAAYDARSCRAAPLILGRAPVAEIVAVTEDGVEYKRRIGAADGAMTHDGATPTRLSSAGGPNGKPFTAAMAGAAITVAGAGAAGAALTTTISSVIDDETVALAAPALTTVSGASYELDNPAFVYDLQAAAGMLWKLDGCGYRTWFSASVAAVEYKAGWTAPDPDGEIDQAYTLPADIEDACLMLIRRKLEQQRPDDPSFGRLESESLPGAGTWKWAIQAITWEGGLPSDVIEILKPYRRLHV